MASNAMVEAAAIAVIAKAGQTHWCRRTRGRSLTADMTDAGRQPVGPVRTRVESHQAYFRRLAHGIPGTSATRSVMPIHLGVPSQNANTTRKTAAARKTAPA